MGARVKSPDGTKRRVGTTVGSRLDATAKPASRRLTLTPTFLDTLKRRRDIGSCRAKYTASRLSREPRLRALGGGPLAPAPPDCAAYCASMDHRLRGRPRAGKSPARGGDAEAWTRTPPVGPRTASAIHPRRRHGLQLLQIFCDPVHPPGALRLDHRVRKRLRRAGSTRCQHRRSPSRGVIRNRLLQR